MQLDERTLIIQAKAGQEQAFAHLVDMHGPRVMGIALSLLGNRADAEDAYQDIFVKAFDKLTSFRFKASFGTWLGRLAVNYCLDWRRRKHRKPVLMALHRLMRGSDEISAMHGSPEVPASNTSDKNLYQKEIRLQVVQAMHVLSERERAVFVLKYEQEYKIREIADLLNCAEGTVKNYLFRATQKMRTRLQGLREYTLLD